MFSAAAHANHLSYQCPRADQLSLISLLRKLSLWIAGCRHANPEKLLEWRKIIRSIPTRSWCHSLGLRWLRHFDSWPKTCQLFVGIVWNCVRKMWFNFLGRSPSKYWPINGVYSSLFRTKASGGHWKAWETWDAQFLQKVTRFALIDVGAARPRVCKCPPSQIPVSQSPF